MSIIQYLNDTRAELRHVAWPTGTQTVIFTVLVSVISILVALYLGFFDFLFTRALSEGLQFLPQESAQPLEVGNIEFAPDSSTTPDSQQPTANN